MWSGGDDLNDKGEPVRLYQPIQYGRKPLRDDLTCSFIGGDIPSTEQTVCASCQQPLNLLVQLFIPKSSNHQNVQASIDRTLQVFACNRADCTNQLFSENKLSYGGGGVVVCRRIAPVSKIPVNRVTENITEKEISSAWTEGDGAADDDENDWAVDTTTATDDTRDLEHKLAAMEAAPTVRKAKASIKKPKSKTSTNSFPCYELHSVQEPPAVRSEGMDEDDVGISGSDEKIQNMLARYMAEEEDEDILAALRGATGGGGGGRGSGGRERDERLSAADRALLSFSDRLKRSPRQVLRYAYAGVPMWSIPVGETKQRSAKAHATQQPIPPCPSCGADRVFEVQLLPSLLHILEVDKYADNSSSNDKTGLDAAYEEGGMNWGNIAIYTCSRSSCAADTGLVVVQDSVEELPGNKRQAFLETGDVIIQEDAKFEDDDDYGEEDDDMEEEDNDDEC